MIQIALSTNSLIAAGGDGLFFDRPGVLSLDEGPVIGSKLRFMCLKYRSMGQSELTSNERTCPSGIPKN
jgi:hypothetical protein